MEFRIKSDSLPRIIAKSFLVALIVLILLIGLIAIKRDGIFVLSTWFSSGLQETLLRSGIYMVLIFSLIPLACFLAPYFRRNDLLLIDDHGIRFDCYLWPLQSWRITWQDIQLPITHACLIPKSKQQGALYIQLNRPDDYPPQSKSKWYNVFFIPLGGRPPSNKVFTLDMVSMWQANSNTGSTPADALKEKADKRPAIIREIERHLGQGAIKKTFFAPHILAEQAKETQHKKRKLHPSPYDLDPVAAQCLCIGAIFLILLGLVLYRYWFLGTYLLNPSWAPYVFAAIPVAAISLWPLRRYKNVWLTSLIVALVFGATFMWALFSSAQFGARLWGPQEIRIFVLQAPSPPDTQKNKRSPRLTEQLWLSDDGKENNTRQPVLKLEISADLARQPYQPGSRVELSVRRSLFGQYVLNIKEADAHFKQNLNGNDDG